MISIPTTYDVTILGAGFTGGALVRLLAEKKFSFVASRRHPPAAGEEYIRFDLGDRSSWDAVPASRACAWLFPAEPGGMVREFLQTMSGRLGRVVVVGTTSSYLVRAEGVTVSESTPLDRTLPRVQGELEALAQGAVVLRAAGIYGPVSAGLPDRNPLDWLRRGMIASREKLVNLIHVDDLAAAILSAAQSDAGGEEFIVTDGTPRRWGEIEEWGRKRGFLEEVRYSAAAGGVSRKLSSARLHARLRPNFTHTDLFAELTKLEGG